MRLMPYYTKTSPFSPTTRETLQITLMGNLLSQVKKTLTLKKFHHMFCHKWGLSKLKKFGTQNQKTI